MAADDDASDLLVKIEGHLLAGPKQHGDAKDSLRSYLRRVAGEDGNDLSIAELVEYIAKERPSKEVASILIRSLGSEGVIPDRSASANIARSIVQICEASQPSVIKFLRIDPAAQTYEKYQKLSVAHQELVSNLGALRAKYASIDSLMSAQKNVLGSLNHGVLNSYAEVFGMSEVRLVVEDLYAKLKSVAQLSTTLSDDVQNCRASLDSARRVASEIGTFLSAEYLIPFINSVDSAVGDLSQSLGERFATTVTLANDGELAKRYPLHQIEKLLKISVPLRNTGPGKLVNLQAAAASTSDEVVVLNGKIILGDVTPGQFSIIVDIQVQRWIDKFALILDLEWNEVGGGASKSEIFEITVRAQSADVDWTSHEHWAPYSTAPAQGDEFVGRLEKIKLVAGKILRTSMEPFYITGQKRVGKTSLVNACVDFAEKQSKTHEICGKYILWGNIAYENPHATLRELGNEFAEILRSKIDLRHIPESDYSESLAPLVKLCQAAYEIDPKKKFVLIIDEFDELHQELYLQGNLAETFFANLRALTRCKNICVALVGGENMPYVMDRQGQKLNNFSKISLNYYDRDREWPDYKLLISEPTRGILSWHEDAISEVFNISNGNPYFTKIVCAAVFQRAVQERDADITAEEIRSVVTQEISSLGANSFAHLWQDGIPKPVAEREPEILARVRVLVAIARGLRERAALTSSKISTYRSVIELTESGVLAVLNDFVRREVLTDSAGVYTVLLPIFSRWLEDVGITQLAETSLSAELAKAVVDAEAAAAVRSEELAKLVRDWPTYRGRHIGADDVRAWLQQVPSLQHQRLLFKLLKNIHFFTDVFIRERLDTLHRLAVLPHLPQFVMRRNSDRRRDMAVTYVDGEGKSGGTYASYYAEQNLIATDCIIPPSEFSSRLNRLRSAGSDIKTVVIVDDLAATGKSLSDNVLKFLESNRRALTEVPTKVVVCTIAATAAARDYISRSFNQVSDIDLDFRTAEILEARDMAFSSIEPIWANQEEFDAAKSLCTDLGVKIYGRQNALGYGGLGLLVVFTSSIPNNSLPILHSPARAGSNATWQPLFRRVIH